MEVNTTSVVTNRIQRTDEEGGWTIGAANGTNSVVRLENVTIAGNTNIQVSRKHGDEVAVLGPSTYSLR